MKRPQMVYMDHCAWQELSRQPRRVNALRSSASAGSICFALSVPNLEELVFGLTRARSDSKRVRIAKAMQTLGSKHHLFRVRHWIHRAELVAALEGIDTIGPFLPCENELFCELWDILRDLARNIPVRMQLLKDVQAQRNATKEELRGGWQEAVDRTSEEAATKGVSMRELSDEVIFHVVMSRYEEMCEGIVLEDKLGRALMERDGRTEAIKRLHSTRRFVKAGLLLALRRGQSGAKMEPGDWYDVDHLVFGSYADVFVTNDGGLRNRCLDMHDHLDEPCVNCRSVAEFSGNQEIT